MYLIKFYYKWTLQILTERIVQLFMFSIVRIMYIFAASQFYIARISLKKRFNKKWLLL